jgi:predicted AlkP superfamily phosphohydrolase/phosphomutase
VEVWERELATRILLLEIDAGDRKLMLDWAAAGILPNLRSLLAKGLVGQTTTPPGLYVGATWPSFFTGVSPARHGTAFTPWRSSSQGPTRYPATRLIR